MPSKEEKIQGLDRYITSIFSNWSAAGGPFGGGGIHPARWIDYNKLPFSFDEVIFCEECFKKNLNPRP